MKYYPLSELMEEVRENYPAGQTLALKKAGRLMKRIGGDPVSKLTILNCSPEDYVLDTDTLAAEGITSRHVPVSMTRTNKLPIISQTEKRSRRLLPVHFSGQILLPEFAVVSAIGAYVQGEQSTGFIHVVEGERVEEIFTGQPLKMGEVD